MSITFTGMIDTPIKDIRSLVLVDQALAAFLEEAHPSDGTGGLPAAIARNKARAVDTSITPSLMVQMRFFAEKHRVLSVFFDVDYDGRHIGASKIICANMSDDEIGRNVVTRVTRALSLLGDAHVRSEVRGDDDYYPIGTASFVDLVNEGILSAGSLRFIMPLLADGLIHRDRSIDDVLGMPKAEADDWVEKLYGALGRSSTGGVHGFMRTQDEMIERCRDLADETPGRSPI